MKPQDSNKFKILNDMFVGKPDGEGPWDHTLPDDRPMQVASKLNSIITQYRKFGVNASKVSVAVDVMASLLQSPNAKAALSDDKNKIVYNSSDFDVDIVCDFKFERGQIRLYA